MDERSTRFTQRYTLYRTIVQLYDIRYVLTHVRIPEAYPDPMSALWSSDTDISRKFLAEIRHFNQILGFTSFGPSGHIEDFGYGHRTTFRVQGQIYHNIGSLLPISDAQPRFLQIYFMRDREERVEQRLGIFRGLDRSIINVLVGI